MAAQNGAWLIAGALMRNEAPFANYRIGYGLFGGGGNQLPVAVAAANPSGGDVPLAVNFSSAGSTDPDGSIAAFAWDFGDGGASTAPNPSHTYATAGPFIAHLTITDNAGSQTTQAILVQAVAPNQPPVAVAVADPASGPAPLNVTFTADQSYDPDGTIGNFTWTYHDGSYTYGSTGYYTYNQPGTYVVTLTVYDGRNATGIDTVTVTVGNAATATPTATPTIAATRTRTPPLAPPVHRQPRRPAAASRPPRPPARRHRSRRRPPPPARPRRSLARPPRPRALQRLARPTRPRPRRRWAPVAPPTACAQPISRCQRAASRRFPSRATSR